MIATILIVAVAVYVLANAGKQAAVLWVALRDGTLTESGFWYMLRTSVLGPLALACITLMLLASR